MARYYDSLLCRNLFFIMVNTEIKNNMQQTYNKVAQTLIRLENRWLCTDIFPDGGGKITSIFNKKLQYEFLWKNQQLNLESYRAGTEYDPVFYGGVDELLPNDIPETVDGMDFPDHGELWTTALKVEQISNGITMHVTLPISKLNYQKTIRLDENAPLIHTDYQIRNNADFPVKFLWKLHAALKINKDDRIVCSAEKGQVVDPEFSRFKQTEPFFWPVIEKTDVSLLPEKNGLMDFFYLYDLQQGEVGWENAEQTFYFGYRFDRKVFPYVWIFASYGGFLNHYTAILEPCTTMPISVNDAAELGQTMILQPGETISTTVTIVAGSIHDKNSFNVE